MDIFKLCNSINFVIVVSKKFDWANSCIEEARMSWKPRSLSGIAASYGRLLGYIIYVYGPLRVFGSNTTQPYETRALSASAVTTLFYSLRLVDRHVKNAPYIRYKPYFEAGNRRGP
jgi:hypothetical protein